MGGTKLKCTGTALLKVITYQMGHSGTDNSEAGYVYESHPCAMGIWQREDDTSDVGVLGNLPSSG